MTVTRTIHVNVGRLFKRVKEDAERTAVGYGVERAMHYAPVDTGTTRLDIRATSNTSFGASTRATRYQERVVPTYTKTTPFLAPAAEDVADEMPNIIKKAFRRWAFG